MARACSIAVVGATGAVGRVFLNLLDGRPELARSVRLFASSRSAGTRLQVCGQELVVEETAPGCFDGVDIAFISVSTELSQALAPQAVASGALVIDDSSAFRMQPEVPLVVPEINGADVEDHRGIISIPNCSTTQMVMAVAPLHRVNPVRRILVDTYQSVSGAGGASMMELTDATRVSLSGQQTSTETMPRTIAFNLLPHIGDFLPNGYTQEEEKMAQETRKILHDPEIAISATCVRVPVYVSHSEAVHLEFERPMDPQEARKILSNTPGVQVVDDPSANSYPVPLDAAGEDDVLVGRIRKDWSHPNGLALWVVADNLRKGAALNAIQIAEEVLRRDCLKPAKLLTSSPSPRPARL